MPRTEDNSWHLDKRVPISLILAILFQTSGVIYWAATSSEKISTLERRMDTIQPNSDRLTRVEVKVDNLLDAMNRIEANTRRAALQ